MGEAGGSSVSDATVEAHIIQLLERYQTTLHSFALGMVGERELARDIVQETFIAAWRVACDHKAPFGDPCDEKGVRRWLFAVAYRQSALVLRRQRRIVRPLDQDGVDDMASASPDIATSIVEADALRAALSALRPLDAACFLLQAVQGFGTGEIATIVQLRPAAVRTRLSRARQRLRAAYIAQNAHTTNT
jgi:RNA polymerase sigma-70 factor, ECF subfamily